jgi:hypothetical protein
MLIYATIAIAVFWVVFFFLPKFRKFFSSNVFFMLGNDFNGFTYGPLGTFYQNYFQPMFSLLGTSLAFNMAGIIGQHLRL